MITSEQIRDKARRLFGKAVKAWLNNELDAFFPHRIPANLTPSKDLSTAISEVESLREHCKQTIGSGYRIEWRSRRSRTHGRNEFPDAIFVDTMDDLVEMIDRSSDWKSLQLAVAKIRDQQPRLDDWLRTGTNWKLILELSDVLPDLLRILDHMLLHPRSDCFARELPVPVSTKLIEQHRRRLAIWLDLLLPPD
ncbi:MAG: DUF3322 domain-containing protein, partial [Rhodopirellula sp. JB055]|uniref:DUF3322 domain-containing protein n=1 Tax=Rhodopirellula sp. JB055 TaxID=3342846 RepID=UPI00370B828B